MHDSKVFATYSPGRARPIVLTVAARWSALRTWRPNVTSFAASRSFHNEMVTLKLKASTLRRADRE